MGIEKVALHDDAEHGRGRVGVVEQLVGHLRERVVHVHLVAAHVPVLLGDGVLEVDVVVGGVQGRVHARRHDGEALRVAGVEELDEGRAVGALQLRDASSAKWWAARILLRPGFCAVCSGPERTT